MGAFTDDGLGHLDSIVAEAVEQQQVPGVVAAVARGEDVRVATAGVMALDGPPMRRDTLFRIASITKPMTAAVILSLVEDGAFSLDQPVDSILPELADRQVLRAPDAELSDTVPARRPPTVRELLTFTWGLGMQGAMFMAPRPWPIFLAAAERDLETFGPPAPASTPDPDTWLARLAELPLLAQPGERWLYSTGAQLLGVLASRVTGQPFAEVMDERLFAPLGMRDSGFHTQDVARLATAYRREDGRLVVDDPPDGQWSRPPAFADGAGGLVASVDDVVRFGRALLRGGDGVISPGSVAAMTRDQLTSAQRTAVWPGFDMLSGRGWGYCVSVFEDGSYSWDGGLGTTWSNVPSLDLTVVVLTQRLWDETGPPAVCDAVLQAARDAVC